MSAIEYTTREHSGWGERVEGAYNFASGIHNHLQSQQRMFNGASSGIRDGVPIIWASRWFPIIISMVSVTLDHKELIF